LVLSEHLAGPGMHHPDESDGPMPPLDRWRRALGCVLEALVLLSLAEEMGRAPREDWMWRGLAVDIADRAVPEAGLAQPDLALAVTTGDPGAHPRAGVAAWRAVRARGDVPWAVARRWLGDRPPEAEEWLALGSWVLGSSGIASKLPIPVERVAAVDIPATLGPWRWQPLAVPAHPRGGRVVIEGDAAIVQPWASADQPLRTLAAAGVGGGSLSPDIGGPAGSWAVTSARAFGEVFGIRGISFQLSTSGALQIVLADAFVGPLSALEVAEQVGTSGLVSGRWKVAGAWTLRFTRIADQGLTLHGRQSASFRIPTGGVGMAEWLHALEDSAWRWEDRGDKLVLLGTMMGGDVEMWWRPEGKRGLH
ncbi:MAG: hypothetical protein JRJ84_24855, partial [Deltaproteobacteria bacterium]|nr:hypothetical protein [Deltaproteobacteria bacterium]